MSDDTVVETKSGAASPENRHMQSSMSDWNRNVQAAIAVCSAIQIGCFFLPWVNIFLGKLSGYQVQQLEGAEFKVVWLIPASALAAFFSGVSRTRVRHTAQAAGVMPFLTLSYFAIRIGTDLFRILVIGAWLSLFLGAVLFMLPRFLKKAQP